MESKICIDCKIEKDIEEFYKKNNNKDYRTNFCKKCATERSRKYREKKGKQYFVDSALKYKKENKEKVDKYQKEYYQNNKEKKLTYSKGYYKEKGYLSVRNSHYKNKFGITLDEYNKIAELQNNKCSICNTDKPGGQGVFYLDHDHLTGKIRSILCHHCNTGLGMFKDNIDLLKSAISYLEKHKEEEIINI